MRSILPVLSALALASCAAAQPEARCDRFDPNEQARRDCWDEGVTHGEAEIEHRQTVEDVLRKSGQSMTEARESAEQAR